MGLFWFRGIILKHLNRKIICVVQMALCSKCQCSLIGLLYANGFPEAEPNFSTLVVAIKGSLEKKE